MAEINDLYEVRIVATFGDQTSIMVRHYRADAKVGTGATDLEFATGVNASVAAAMKAIMNTGATYRGVGVRRILPLPIGLESFTIASLGAGTVTGDALPKQISGVITWRTPFGGKSFRGRSYAPFPGEADNDSDAKPSGAYITRLDTLGSQIALTQNVGAGGNTNTFTPVVYSRKFGSGNVIVNRTTRLVWGTQRSRGGYGRSNPPPF